MPMDMLNKMDADVHNVAGVAAELTTMLSYIAGVSKYARENKRHAQYVLNQVHSF